MRVNIESRFWGEGRLLKLQARLKMSRKATVGLLVILWHESQEAVKVSATRSEILDWLCEDDGYDEPDQLIDALVYYRYISILPDGLYLIHGNETQLDHHIKCINKASKGGAATAAKWALLRDAEGYKPSSGPTTSLAPARLKPTQCKAMQGNAKQEERESSSPTITPLVELWNRIAVRLPKASAKLSKQRLAKIQARLKEEPSLDHWEDVIKRLEASDFATGQNDRGWKADFAWLISNSENHLKTIDGRYDNRVPEKAKKEIPKLTGADLAKWD